MFSKLLKYDFKSHVKFGLPLTIITLGLGVIGAIDAFFTFRSIAGEIVNEDLSFGAAMFSSLGIMSFFFILFAIFKNVIACLRRENIFRVNINFVNKNLF